MTRTPLRGRGRILLLAAALLVPALTAGCQDETAEAPKAVRQVRAVQLASVETGMRRWFSGRAKATQEIDLSFRVSGPVIEFPASVGDTVAQGELVARIDPATFLTERRRAEAELERARAELQNAEAQLARLSRLTEQGHAAKAALDNASAAAKVARALVSSAEAALEGARLNLVYTELHAPFSGEVTRTYVENYQDVTATQPIIRLVDSTSIEMIVDVPETMISFVDQVEDIDVVFDPFPDLTVKASIKEVGREANDTTRTYPVTLFMEQPENARILPGMAGRASATNDPSPEGVEALVVPDTAVFAGSDASSSYVWVVDEATGEVAQREVALGRPTRAGHQVLSGVEEGEWVVTAGVHHLEDGQTVRIMGREPSSSREGM